MKDKERFKISRAVIVGLSLLVPSIAAGIPCALRYQKVHSLVEQQGSLRSRIEATQAEYDRKPPVPEFPTDAWIPVESDLPRFVETCVRRAEQMGFDSIQYETFKPVMWRPESGATGQEPPLYRHPVQLQLEGDYTQLREFLDELESEDRFFGLRNLAIGRRFPKVRAIIELEVYARK
ncbi:MAG: hypothetical protein RL885_11520 [Planctomycetota bacterium]